MKFWIIAMKDVKIRLRDRRGLIVLLLMPLVLTLILGSALGGVFNDKSTSMPDMKIALYNGDSGALGKTLANDVLQSDSLKPYITLQKETTPEQVNQVVADGQADVGVVIPANFSQDVTSGKSAAIGVVQDPGKPTSASIVNSIVTSFSDRVSTVAAVSKTAITDVATSMAKRQEIPLSWSESWNDKRPVYTEFDFAQFTKDLAATLQQTSEQPNTSVTDRPVGKHRSMLSSTTRPGWR